VSNTLDAAFCVSALEEALSVWGVPRNLQQRPGEPIHQRGVHRGVAGAGGEDKYGRAESCAGQHCGGTLVEESEI
jgi:hypothetical protein